MTAGNKPIQLDKDITYKEPEKKAEGKSAKIPWPYFVGTIGLILVVALLFINPGNEKFIDSPPPEEQAERDSIYSYAAEIDQYSANYDSLPDHTDVSLPPGFTYEKEDELLWSIETEAGLYYSSDMDPDSFRIGEI